MRTTIVDGSAGGTRRDVVEGPELPAVDAPSKTQRVNGRPPPVQAPRKRAVAPAPFRSMIDRIHGEPSPTDSNVSNKTVSGSARPPFMVADR